MRKSYFFVILLTTVCLFIIFYSGFKITYNTYFNGFIKQQRSLARYQTKLLSQMLSDQIAQDIVKEEIVKNLQKALERTPSDPVFICMFNRYGKEICHPDRNKIGTIIANNDSTIKSFSNSELEENFKLILEKQTVYEGIHRIKKDNKVEIIYLAPVKGTDWILATHNNLAFLDDILGDIKTKLILLFVSTFLCSLVLILFLMNILYNQYFTVKMANVEGHNEFSNKYLNDEKEKNTDQSAKRFLAEKGLKLIPVEVDNIAFIYLENKVTYVVDFNNIKSTLNMSLEDIYDSLPRDRFFRISRQVILSLKSICTIEKFGTVQLKVITNPIASTPIIVSKSKVREFKSWIGESK